MRIVIIFCLVVLFASTASGGERLYTFEDDNAWEPITAKWKIDDGEYVQTGSTDGEIGLAVLKDSEGVDTTDVETIEVDAYDLGTDQNGGRTVELCNRAS